MLNLCLETKWTNADAGVEANEYAAVVLVVLLLLVVALATGY